MLAGTAFATPAEPISIPVLATPLAKGAVVQEANLTSRTLPSSQVFVSTVQTAEQVVGLQTTRSLPAGTPLSTLHLRVPPLVNRGHVVEFIIQRGVVSLKGSGQALEDGAAGQQIRLMNPQTRATLVGTVQANGQVLVN
jgi:flagella basal body P-ring formation protein FlgA